MCGRDVITGQAMYDALAQTGTVIEGVAGLPGCAELLHKLLWDAGDDRGGLERWRLQAEQHQLASELQRRGLLGATDDEFYVTFTSPLHRQYYLTQHDYNARSAGHYSDRPRDFHTFIDRTVQCMRADRLVSAVPAKVGGHIDHRKYQMDFFQSAMSNLPEGAALFPDTGPVRYAMGVRNGSLDTSFA